MTVRGVERESLFWIVGAGFANVAGLRVKKQSFTNASLTELFSQDQAIVFKTILYGFAIAILAVVGVTVVEDPANILILVFTLNKQVTVVLHVTISQFYLVIIRSEDAQVYPATNGSRA